MVETTEIEPNDSASPTAMDASSLCSTSSCGKPRTPGLAHTIYLSHSYADKDFVRELHADLLKSSYDAFFDEVSLPKDEIVTMRDILGEARKCQLAVFVLSDEFFTRTKCGMLELTACVDAQVLLLPLFFRLTIAQFKDKNRRKDWHEKWEQWEREEKSWESGKDVSNEGGDSTDLKVNISKWQLALEKLGNAIDQEYAKSLPNSRQSGKHVSNEEVFLPLEELDNATYLEYAPLVPPNITEQWELDEESWQNLAQFVRNEDWDCTDLKANTSNWKLPLDKLDNASDQEYAKFVPNSREQWVREERSWQSGKDVSNEEGYSTDLKANISKWQLPLEKLDNATYLEYAKFAPNSREYRDAIVAGVKSVVPPDNIRWRDSYMQGKERLCKVVDDMFAHTSDGVAVIGLHGEGGSGKSTLCAALVNFYYRDFRGRVCHVVLDSARSPTERVKTIILELTNASPQVVKEVQDSAEGLAILNENLIDGKVFLAIDNVNSEASIAEARSYLRRRFQSGSKIMITTRSRHHLSRLPNVDLYDRHVDRYPMPDLEAGEAIKIFLQKAVNLPDSELQLSKKQRSIVKRCVTECRPRWLRKSHHPLSLVSLAGLLAGISFDPREWLKALENRNLNRRRLRMDRRLTDDFPVLKSSYDALDEDLKEVFLSIALHVPENLDTDEEIYEWLRFVHEKDQCDMDECLRKLRRSSVLNSNNLPTDAFSVHDLYRDLAREISLEDGRCKSFFLDNCKVNSYVLSRMLQRSRLLESVGFVDCRFECGVLDLGEYSRIKVLQLVGNKGLSTVMLGHATISLRSLEVVSDIKVAVESWENSEGDSRWFRCKDSAERSFKIHRRRLADIDFLPNRIFLSHSSLDKDFARELSYDLEAFR